MYDAVIINGDAELDGCGRVKTVTGSDALLQRAYVSLCVKKGSFKYNRELGVDSDALLRCQRREEAELVLNEALAGLDNTAARVTVFEAHRLVVEVSAGEQTKVWEVSF